MDKKEEEKARNKMMWKLTEAYRYHKRLQAWLDEHDMGSEEDWRG